MSRSWRVRIAGEAMVDERTVRSAYEGVRMHSATWTVIMLAAKRLKLPLPPEQKS